MKLGEYLKLDLIRYQTLCGVETPRAGFWRIVKASLSPRFAPIVLCRLSRAAHLKGYRRISKLCSLVNFVIFGLEVAPQTEIGPGIFFPHTQGTIIGAASIGANVTVFQQVTLGAKKPDFSFNSSLRPSVGDNVSLSSGCKVIGAVNIGNRTTIGPNCVVLEDIPEDCICIPTTFTIAKKENHGKNT